ncbi:hypothetical protein ACQF4J_47005 (plasmid) [Streptomyces sp. C1-1]|uniref:hypothetical protein n=1 Tax=Streptomyces sp. C1-1 TaxID=3231173 RepID=UPI003D0570BA
MIRLLATLVLTAEVVGFLFSIGIAVDVLRQHPYEWMQTGSTQRLRIFLIFAPPLAVLLGPIYLVAGIFYLQRVRPRLTYNVRVATSNGWPVTPRRPTLGLNWAWCELRTPQKVKTVLSMGGAFFLDTIVMQMPQAQDSPPRWFVYFAVIFLWPLFFFVTYLVLGAAQIFLKLKMDSESYDPARMQILAQDEYNRRIADFYANHPPWGQQRRRIRP